MDQNYLSAVKQRRTYYGISKDIEVTPECIRGIVEQAVLHTPSAFNSQSSRTVLLFGGHHEKLWSIVLESLRKRVPEKAFAPTESKIGSFAAGAGTILYFEDMSVVEELQRQFPTYAEHFPLWSLQSNGMLEHVIWTALEQTGLGASLQHYNPIIDDEVHQEWNLPKTWKLLAQMPFGKPTAMPGEKTFQPIEERLKIFGL